MSHTPSTRSPIGVGVVGTGFGRSTQIPAFLHTPGCEVLGVVSHSEQKARETAEKFDIRHAFTANDYDRLLEIDEIDLVCVSSPPDSHCEYTLKALAAGKHVLCEKPTAMNADEARRMSDAARGTGLFAAMDHELRFHPSRRKFRDLVAEGFLGQLYHVNISVESPLRLDPERPWSWWSDASQGGGFLGALGSHVVDAVRYTFDEVTRGRAQLQTFVKERTELTTGEKREVTSDDYAAIWLELEGSGTVSGVLSAASRVPSMGWRMAAHGSGGTLILKGDGRVLGKKNRDEEFSDLTPEWPPFDADALGMMDNMWSRAFILYSAEIIQALQSGQNEVPHASTLEDGLRVQEVLDALRESDRKEGWVPCGPGQVVQAG